MEALPCDRHSIGTPLASSRAHSSGRADVIRTRRPRRGESSTSRQGPLRATEATVRAESEPQSPVRLGPFALYEAFWSLVNRPIWLPSVSSQVANQPMPGMGVLSWRTLPPSAVMFATVSSIESTDIGQRGHGAVSPLEERAVDAWLGLAGGGHPVVLGRAGVSVERPAEHGAVELLRAVRVVDRDLEVRGSRWHAALLSSKRERLAYRAPSEACSERQGHPRTASPTTMPWWGARTT